MNNAIAIIFNKSYLKYAIPFLNSIKKNWNNHPIILCHHCDLDTEDLATLTNYSNIKLIHTVLSNNEYGINPPYRADGFTYAYSKLKLWSSDYDEYDNILYLDVDTLVLKPMEELFLKSKFTIFRNRMNIIFKEDSDKEHIKKLLEEDSILQYIHDTNLNIVTGNSGVFLLPRSYRTQENYEYLLYLTHRYSQYNRFADQSIINLWMLKTNIPVNEDTRFNFLSVYLKNPDYMYKLEDAYLIHFIWIKPIDVGFREWNDLDGYHERLISLYNSYIEFGASPG